MSSVLSLAATLAFAASAEAAPDDWPRFLGPGGRGLAPADTWTSLPDPLSAESFAWRMPLGVEGHSSPVVRDGRVFLTGVHDDGHLELQCRSASNGELRWSRELEFKGAPQHKFNSYASSTPAVDEDFVYLTWTSGGRLILRAFDLEGEDVWERELGAFAAQHGSGASPIVVGEVVILGNDHEGEGSFLVAVDRANGKTRWEHRRDSSRAAYMTPVLYENPKGETEVVFSSTSHGLTALDPVTGELQWEVSGDFEQRCVGAPGFADGVFFQCAGAGGGGKESFAVRPYAKGDEPEVLYRLRRALPYVPVPLGVGEHFFLWSDGGILSCVHAASGEQRWQERVEAAFFGSPICVGDRMMALSKEGELVVVRASEEFELLAKIELGEPSFATPAVADGVVYLRTLSHLIALGEKTD